MPNINSKEISTLIELVRQDSDPAVFDADRTDWKKLFVLAEKHRLIPLIFECLQNLSYAGHESSEQLRNRNNEITKQNFGRCAQLIKVGSILEKHSIEQLSYKGLALSGLAYGGTMGRQFTDLDFLVKPEDAKRAVEVLIRSGCRPAYKTAGKQTEAAFKYDYEYPVYYGETDTLVEIHWAFVEPFFTFDYDAQGCFKRSVQTEIHGRPVNTLSPEDHLVVICVHSSKHFWTRLSWICDVDRLVSNTNPDWDLVLELAENSESARMLLLGLSLSRKLLKTTLPSKIVRAIERDDAVLTLTEKMTSRLLSGSPEPGNWKEMAKFHISMREKVKTKSVYSFRLLQTKIIDKLFMPMGRPR